MGRLSTAVAAVGVDAGNLPEKLPNISLWDAFLPHSKKVRNSHIIVTYRLSRLIYIPRMISAHPHAKEHA
jgi:hypothetical protein